MACCNLPTAEPPRWLYIYRAAAGVACGRAIPMHRDVEGRLRPSFKQAYKELVEFGTDRWRNYGRAWVMWIARFDRQKYRISQAPATGADFAVTDRQAMDLAAAELGQAQAEVWAELNPGDSADSEDSAL